MAEFPRSLNREVYTMKLSRLIWQDIRRGENIDLYVTVIVSLVLTILNVTGMAPASSVTPLTLAVLALVAITILGNRHRLELIIERTSPSSEKVVYEQFPPEFKDDLERAREVWLIGIHQSDVMIIYHSLFEKKLRAGDSLRVLLADPEGMASEMTEMRFPGEINPGQERARIKTSLNTLCQLKQVAPDRLEIRTIDFLLAYGGFALNPTSSTGVVYIQRYTFRTHGGAHKPKLVYRHGDGQWYDLICDEIRALWEAAEPWDCSSPKPQVPKR
jgi:hypothetical protein